MSTVTGLEMTQKGHYVSSQVGILLRGEQPKKGDIVVSDLDSVKVGIENILIQPSVQDSVLMRTSHCVSLFRDRETLDAVIGKLIAARDTVFPRMPVDIEQEFECFLAEGANHEADPINQREAARFLAKMAALNPTHAGELLADHLRPQ